MFCSAILDYNESRAKNWPFLNITRPYSMLYYIVGGTGHYKIKNETFPFKKKHIYFFPSNTEISLLQDENDQLTLTYIHAFISPELDHVIELDTSKDKFLTHTIQFIRMYIKKSNTVYTRKLSEMLVSYVSELTEENFNSLGAKIKRYIDQNYITVFKDNDIAKQFNYSNSHILKVFKENYNLTPKQYALKLLLKHILNLLQSGYQVNHIANVLNFSSPENFSRFFKNNYGCSPSHYSNSTPPPKKTQ